MKPPEEKVESVAVSFRTGRDLVERVDRSAAAMSKKTGLSVNRSDVIELALKRYLDAEDKERK